MNDSKTVERIVEQMAAMISRNETLSKGLDKISARVLWWLLWIKTLRNADAYTNEGSTIEMLQCQYFSELFLQEQHNEVTDLQS